MLVRISLRWRIGALVLFGLLGIFALFAVLGAEIAQDARQRTIEQWVSLTRSTASFIDSELAGQFDHLTLLAARLNGSLDDSTQRTTVLNDSALVPSSFVAGAFLLDGSGAVRWADPNIATALPALLKSDTDAADPLRSNQQHASGALDLGGRVAIILDVPVRARDGHAVGVLGTVIRPDKWVVNDLIASARGLAHTGHAELVDRNDIVIVSSEPGRALGVGEHPDFYEPLLAHRSSDAGLTSPVGGDGGPDTGQRHEMAFVPLTNAGWGLALGGSDAELSADADRWQTQIALFGGSTIVVALFLVWVTTRTGARRAPRSSRDGVAR